MEKVQQPGALILPDQGLINRGEEISGFQLMCMHHIVHEIAEFLLGNITQLVGGQFTQIANSGSQIVYQLNFTVFGFSQGESEILGSEIVHPVPGAGRPDSEPFQIGLGEISQVGDNRINIPGMNLQQGCQMTDLNLLGKNLMDWKR